MAGKKGKRRVAKEGVKVTAVATDRGPPSTSVHVEVETEKLRETVGDFGAVKRVTAEIPQASGEGGKVRWEEEQMSPLGRPAERGGARRENVERYFGVHYGPTDARRLGVGVRIETDAGTVRAQSRGESYTVSDPDRPGESERKRRPE